MGWIRRNAVVILLALVVIGQIGTWWGLMSVRQTIERWACGSVLDPCKVVIKGPAP